MQSFPTGDEKDLVKDVESLELRLGSELETTYDRAAKDRQSSHLVDGKHVFSLLKGAIPATVLLVHLLVPLNARNSRRRNTVATAGGHDQSFIQLPKDCQNELTFGP